MDSPIKPREGRDFSEILSSELISVTGGIFAGVMLSFSLNNLEIIPSLFILLPGFLEMRGNISGSLASRLSSALFLGVMKPELKRNRIINGNVISSMILVVVVSLVLGIIAMGVTYVLLNVVQPQIILIALIAGIVSNAIEIPLTIFASVWFFRNGHDPNNIMGPYVTTTGDIVSILALMLAIVMVV